MNLEAEGINTLSKHEAIKHNVLKIFGWLVLLASVVRASCGLNVISTFTEERKLSDAMFIFERYILTTTKFQIEVSLKISHTCFPCTV
jgi:hypothetical protein